ncbi:hypothetical protein FB45DRAFT_802223 [Roridomyces roridus]|uniref:Nephrocystin 3-like N-terminal domain-containing protein n=1 Tax=Roridomyces roridus TaxID=1738132 RepID=A0AAD7B8W9_9AGAR|nr:hypothetical protein FB45DRAFT_802223 [Roridomyces roridus]
MHDSAERPADPSCHPGTREAILDVLDRWSSEQPEDGTILWLHGCAGIGKSAIAQQFAASCHSRGQLGGSFFFRRGSASCGTWRNLLPTLAYQLTIAFPQLAPMIQRAVETDRLILGKGMRQQLEKFLVQPFRDAPSLGSRPILVIDGLDECDDRGTQTTLLRSLLDILRSGDSPLHILVCSRSEPHLREVFENPDNLDVCRGLGIQRDKSAYADIRQYFTQEFSRIYRIHSSRGVPLADEWPGRNIIEHLVKRSSGTFIYASTVLRYVDDEYSHPEERLEAVLTLDPASLTTLDDLYLQIIWPIPNKPMLIRVLHAILATRDLDPEEIDLALHMRRGTSRVVLRGLHAVLQVAPVRTIGLRKPVDLLHASFGDFLVDPQRSLSFCVSGEDLQSAFVHDIASALSSGSLQPLHFRTLTSAFVAALLSVPPSDNLFPVLRNVDVQHEVYCNSAIEPKFSDAYRIVKWLEGYSPRPLDLIMIWVDLFKLTFGFQLPIRLSPQTGEDYPPGSVSHQEYIQSPDLLSALRISTVLPPNTGVLSRRKVLDLLALKWDVFVPLLKVTGTGLVDLAAIHDFLKDPEKCGALFMPTDEILRLAAVHCIRRMWDITRTKDFFKFNLEWISILCRCKPDDVLRDALTDLDLAQLCSTLQLDEEYHLECHSDFMNPKCFGKFLEWMHTGDSDPPPQLIRSWEQQKKAVEECCARLQLGTVDSEDE